MEVTEIQQAGTSGFKPVPGESSLRMHALNFWLWS